MRGMSKEILITGGCGFIGTNAAVRFRDLGYLVTVLDNFSRIGSPDNRKYLEQEGGIDIIELDIVPEPERLSALVKERGFDAIIHTAAQVAVTSSITDPMNDFKQNVLGTLHVLEAARGSEKKPHVLFTSTNKVYGEMEDVPVEEQETRYTQRDFPHGLPESHPLDFHSPYGCSKGAADQYVRDYSRIYGFPTTVFRQSCIYGKHQFGIVDQGWVAFLTMQAVFDKPITIYGNGKQVRDLLYVDDLIDAMHLALKKPEESASKIYNMGGGPEQTRSVGEFVSFLGTRLGKEPSISYEEWRPGDQKVYVSDIRKAEHDLGWKPQISFEDGFERMLTWITENREVLEIYL